MTSTPRKTSIPRNLTKVIKLYFDLNAKFVVARMIGPLFLVHGLPSWHAARALTSTGKKTRILSELTGEMKLYFDLVHLDARIVAARMIGPGLLFHGTPLAH